MADRRLPILFYELNVRVQLARLKLSTGFSFRAFQTSIVNLIDRNVVPSFVLPKPPPPYGVPNKEHFPIMIITWSTHELLKLI